MTTDLGKPKRYIHRYVPASAARARSKAREIVKAVAGKPAIRDMHSMRYFNRLTKRRRGDAPRAN